MKRLKLILIACCATLFLGLISPSINAQEPADCSSNYEKIQEAIPKVAEIETLYNIQSPVYPHYTERILLAAQLFYQLCPSYKSRFHAQFTIFWRAFINRKYGYYFTMASMGKSSCLINCSAFASRNNNSACRSRCEQIYRREVSEYNEKKAKEAKGMEDFFKKNG